MNQSITSLSTRDWCIKDMSKVILIVGGLIVVYAIIAKTTGIPELIDFFPVNWFSDSLKSSDHSLYQVVPGNGSSYSWLYTAIFGAALIIVGGILIYLGFG